MADSDDSLSIEVMRPEESVSTSPLCSYRFKEIEFGDVRAYRPGGPTRRSDPAALAVKPDGTFTPTRENTLQVFGDLTAELYDAIGSGDRWLVGWCDLDFQVIALFPYLEERGVAVRRIVPASLIAAASSQVGSERLRVRLTNVCVWGRPLCAGQHRGDPNALTVRMPIDGLLGPRSVDGLIVPGQQVPLPPLFQLLYDPLGNLFYRRVLYLPSRRDASPQ